MTIRVLIADDQEIVRTGLTMILDAQPGIEVVGEAANGREAVALARRLRPDVCLFDIRMPEVDGIEATRQLAGPEVDDPLAVVVITAFDDTHPGQPLAQPREPLTSREEEVLIPVAHGWTNHEIADELHISLSTVKTHLASLMRKLNARNRVEIAMWAYESRRTRK